METGSSEPQGGSPAAPKPKRTRKPPPPPQPVRPTVPWAYAIPGAVLVLLLGGVAGFFVGRSSVAVEKPQIAATQPQALPKGVTRLPTQKFDHWNLGCVENAQKQRTCELVLRAVDRARKALVLSLVVVRSAKGNPTLVVITPPSAMLQAGVRLVPGSKKELKASFTTCAPGSCQAAITLADPVLSDVSSADSLQVSYVAGSGRTVKYALPNAGFREGYEAWKKN